jgi:hypothetical protein
MSTALNLLFLFSSKTRVCHIVELPFTWKNILRQKLIWFLLEDFLKIIIITWGPKSHKLLYSYHEFKHKMVALAGKPNKGVVCRCGGGDALTPDSWGAQNYHPWGGSSAWLFWGLLAVRELAHLNPGYPGNNSFGRWRITTSGEGLDGLECWMKKCNTQKPRELST